MHIGKYFLYGIGGIGALGIGGYMLFKAITKLQLKAMTAAMKQEELALTFGEKMIGQIGGFLMNWTQKRMMKDLYRMSEIFMFLNHHLVEMLKESDSLGKDLPSNFFLLIDSSSFEQDNEFVHPNPTNPDPELWRTYSISFFVSRSLLRPERRDSVENTVSSSNPKFEDLFFSPLHPMADQSLTHQIQISVKVSDVWDQKDLDGKAKVVVEKCVLRDIMGRPGVTSFAGLLQRKIDTLYHNWPETMDEEQNGYKGEEEGDVIIDAEFKEKKNS